MNNRELRPWGALTLFVEHTPYLEGKILRPGHICDDD